MVGGGCLGLRRGGEVTLIKANFSQSTFHFQSLDLGVDLLSVLGRYDTAGVGRISANEMCAALADLGISSVTQREALDLADRFKSAVGEFVMYRRVVTELLRHLDAVTGAADVDVLDVVRAALARSKVDVKRLRDKFEYYDRSAAGRVKEEDLETIFEEANLRLRRSEIEAIGDRFAAGHGWVQYTSFIAALEGEGISLILLTSSVKWLRRDTLSALCLLP